MGFFTSNSKADAQQIADQLRSRLLACTFEYKSAIVFLDLLTEYFYKHGCEMEKGEDKPERIKYERKHSTLEDGSAGNHAYRDSIAGLMEPLMRYAQHDALKCTWDSTSLTSIPIGHGLRDYGAVISMVQTVLNLQHERPNRVRLFAQPRFPWNRSWPGVGSYEPTPGTLVHRVGCLGSPETCSVMSLSEVRLDGPWTEENWRSSLLQRSHQTDPGVWQYEGSQNARAWSIPLRIKAGGILLGVNRSPRPKYNTYYLMRGGTSPEEGELFFAPMKPEDKLPKRTHPNYSKERSHVWLSVK